MGHMPLPESHRAVKPSVGTCACAEAETVAQIGEQMKLSIYAQADSSNNSSRVEVGAHDAIPEKMKTDTENITSHRLMRPHPL